MFLSALPDNQANAGSASDKCYSNYTSNVFKAMMTVFSRGGNHYIYIYIPRTYPESNVLDD